MGVLRNVSAFNSGLRAFKTRMDVVPVACWSDNYAYLIMQENQHKAIVVDPTDEVSVMKSLEQHKKKLGAVLIHHHLDHTNGLLNLLEYKENIEVPVYGGDNRIDGLNSHIKHGEEINFNGMNIKALATPGHTMGSVSYYITHKNTSKKLLFTGDTLFVAGCGRLFEGTKEEMYESLNRTIASLPSETFIYCGHEYTKTIEPENKDIADKILKVGHSKCTVPTTINEELKTNPFLRCGEESVIKATGLTSDDNPVDVWWKLRQLKDNF